MLDFSFAQVCLVVSATAVLMGRHETVTAARYLGKGFGRFVGTLQGYRAKYEGSVKDSALYDLQTSVRKELNELRGVSMDMSMVSSNRLTLADTNTMIQKSDASLQYEMSQASGSSSTMSDSGISSSPQLMSGLAGMGNTQNVKLRREEELFKLSRMILADEQLQHARFGASSKFDQVASGADIINTCVSESILNAAFAAQSGNMVADTDKRA